MIIITSKIFKNIDNNNYIKKYLKTLMIIIDDNNYIENIQRDW